MERVEIALEANDRYFWGLCVTATSISVNASKNLILSFNLLLDDVPSSKVDLLVKRLSELHPNIQCKTYSISLELFKDYPTLHGNHVTYARLLLPNLMPESDYVIYSDVDFLWLTDIGELWAQRNPDIILQGVVEGPNIQREQEWATSRGLPFNPESYICAGLCFFNLALMRKEGSVDKMFAFLKEHPDILMHDQTTLNLCFVNRIRLLPTKWMEYDLGNKFNEKSSNVWHYSGGNAPWNVIRGLHTTRWWKAFFCWHSYSGLFYDTNTLASVRMANSLGRTSYILLVRVSIMLRLYETLKMIYVRLLSGNK